MLDVKRILDTIHEYDEWYRRKAELESRMRSLPRSDRATLRAELEIVRQQLQHYQALMEDMKRGMHRSTVDNFFKSI